MKKIIYFTAVVASIISTANTALANDKLDPFYAAELALQTPVKRVRVMEPVAGNNAEGAVADLLARLVAAGEANEEQKNALTRLNAELAGTKEELGRANQVIHDRDSALTQQQEEFRTRLADKDQEMQKRLEEANKRIAELESANPEGEAAAAEDTIAFQARIVELEEQKRNLEQQQNVRVDMFVKPGIERVVSDAVDLLSDARITFRLQAWSNLFNMMKIMSPAAIVKCKEIIEAALNREVSDPKPRPSANRKKGTRASVSSNTQEEERQKQNIRSYLDQAQRRYDELISTGAEVHEEEISSTELRQFYDAMNNAVHGERVIDPTLTDKKIADIRVEDTSSAVELIYAYRDKLDAIAGKARETLKRWWELVNGSEMTQGDKQEIEESDVLGLIRALDGMLGTLADKVQTSVEGEQTND